MDNIKRRLLFDCKKMDLDAWVAVTVKNSYK